VLQHEFGVKTPEIEWYMERLAERSHGGATGTAWPDGVTVHQIPHTTNIGEMLVNGELDAALLYLTNPNLVDRSSLDLSKHSRVRPMFPDREAEAHRYYAKTGLLPINHTVVVRRSLVEQHPWLPLNLYAAFNKAHQEVNQRGQEYLASYVLTGLLGADAKKALQHDPMAYGMRATRKVLETITQYVHEQGLTKRRVALEELFAPSTMDL
jgi:4,5-dihydroxyphthalate decarboxylase